MVFRPVTAPTRVLIGVLATIAVVASPVVAAVARPATGWYPSAWDPRIAPIAREVARLRGLEFDHPVPVRFLSSARFERRIGAAASDLDRASRRELAHASALLRTLGLVGPAVDLAGAVEAAQQSGVLALYSPEEQEIVVRGATIDVSHRVTLAHELTHALQDQHFDLQELERRAEASDRGTADGLKALIEGDAVRIQGEYESRLSDAERRAYERQQAAEGARARSRSRSVPDAVELFFEAPYVYGPQTVRVLQASGGNRSVDRALKGPAPTTRIFVETGDLAEAVTHVPSPRRPPGTVAAGGTVTFTPSDLYFALAARLDAARALDAADVADDGRAVGYTRGRTYCFTAAIPVRPGRHRAVLVDTLSDWRAMAPPGAAVSVSTSGRFIVLDACDPGAAAIAPPSGRVERAASLLAVRGELTAELVEAGRDPGDARCAARVLLKRPGLVDLLNASSDREPTANERSRLRGELTSAESACRGAPSAGLP